MFSDWLRRQMKGRESQYSLAEKLGVSRMTVYYWLTGRQRPSASNFRRLCSHFGEPDAVTLARELWLFDFDEYDLVDLSSVGQVLSEDLYTAVFDEACNMHRGAEFASANEVAAPLYRHALNLFTHLANAISKTDHAKPHRQFARMAAASYYHAAGIEQIVDMNTRAIHHSQKAETLASAVSDGEMLVEATRTEGIARHNLGDEGGAMLAYGRVLNLKPERVHPDAAFWLPHLQRDCAISLLEAGHISEGEDFARRSLTGFESADYGPGVVIAKATLGDALRLQGKTVEAQAILVDAYQDCHSRGTGPIHRVVSIRAATTLYASHADEAQRRGQLRPAHQHSQHVRDMVEEMIQIAKDAGLKHQLRKIYHDFPKASNRWRNN